MDEKKIAEALLTSTERVNSLIKETRELLDARSTQARAGATPQAGEDGKLDASFIPCCTPDGSIEKSKIPSLKTYGGSEDGLAHIQAVRALAEELKKQNDRLMAEIKRAGELQSYLLVQRNNELNLLPPDYDKGVIYLNYRGCKKEVSEVHLRNGVGGGDTTLAVANMRGALDGFKSFQKPSGSKDGWTAPDEGVAFAWLVFSPNTGNTFAGIVKAGETIFQNNTAQLSGWYWRIQ